METLSSVDAMFLLLVEKVCKEALGTVLSTPGLKAFKIFTLEEFRWRLEWLIAVVVVQCWKAW